MVPGFEVGDKFIPADPNMVSQRIVMLQDKQQTLQDSLQIYELAPFPVALFGGIGFRKRQKSKLYASFSPIENMIFPSTKITVFDGGYLLHRVYISSI